MAAIFTEARRGDGLAPDGRFGCTWDGERCDRLGSILDAGEAGARRVRSGTPAGSNQRRLVKIESKGTAATTGKIKEEYAYDHAGRRVLRKVYHWDAMSSSYATSTSYLFLYDGWNPVVRLVSGGSARQAYTWGLDLSGSAGGAGGVGGLLLVADHDGTTTKGHAPAYDGNGNVIAMVETAAEAVSAAYDYDAFGGTTRATGTFASGNPFRFSTKCADATGLYYYGYRYYSPQTGRWISRDPIGERGGLNLYGFVSNDGVNRVDRLGLAIVVCEIDSLTVGTPTQ